MGFFDKIKQSLNIGGVHVQLQAPDNIDLNDPSVACSVTVTTKSTQTVKSIKVGLYVQEYDSGTAATQFENNAADRHGVSQDISVVTVSEMFTIQPSETKSFDVVIPLHTEQSLGNVGDVLSKVGSILNQLDGDRKQYYIEASADVEGAALDPSDKQNVNVGGLHLNIGG